MLYIVSISFLGEAGIFESLFVVGFGIVLRLEASDEQEDTQVEAEAVIECLQEAIGYDSIDQEVSQWESNGCGNDKQTDIEASEKQSDVMRLGSIDLADGHLLASHGSIHG